MGDTERREAARQFINKWKGKGNEDQDSQLYWIDFLSNVCGMENVTDRVNFEKKVIVDGHSKKIDVYIYGWRNQRKIRFSKSKLIVILEKLKMIIKQKVFI